MADAKDQNTVRRVKVVHIKINDTNKFNQPVNIWHVNGKQNTDKSKLTNAIPTNVNV